MASLMSDDKDKLSLSYLEDVESDLFSDIPVVSTNMAAPGTLHPPIVRDSVGGVGPSLLTLEEGANPLVPKTGTELGQARIKTEVLPTIGEVDTKAKPPAATASISSIVNATEDTNGRDLFACVDEEVAAAEREAVARNKQEQHFLQEAEHKRIELEQQQKLMQEQMKNVHIGNGSPFQQPPVSQQPHQTSYGLGLTPSYGHERSAYTEQLHPTLYSRQQQNAIYGNMTNYHNQQQVQASMQHSQMINPGHSNGVPTSRIPAQPGYLTPPEPAAHRQPQAEDVDTFYRNHALPPQPDTSADSSLYQQSYSPGSNYRAIQAQQQQQLTNRYYQPTQAPSTLAGMHNPSSQVRSLGQAPRLVIVKPPPITTVYEKVLVTEPILVATQKGLLGSLTGQSTPHWSYQITTHFKPMENNQQAPYWVVRRRFRHVVALEDRLHEEIPGSILPPRPDKHATRALEEATTQQSAEFAIQRAAELQVYLNQLIQHPYAHSTHCLRLFLSLQDDLGTAWPEVSSNALTRFANASVSTAVKVSETTASAKFPWQGDFLDDYGEDNAELLALANQEQVRMAAVMQAVPKLEGAITLLREGAERMGGTGMELGRLAKEVVSTDTALSQPMNIISSGMLRSGRRNKRLALELFAALHSYSQHYKSCRYEKMAFYDRRLAMMRRTKERGRSDQRVSQMYQQQQQIYQQPYGYNAAQQPFMNPQLQMSQQLQTSTTDAWQECEEIGQRLRSEINRLAYQRRTDWFSAVKVVASSYKEATTENAAIWAAVREDFLQAFPQYNDEIEEQQGRQSQLRT